jgi:pimeloyl-ACP methyl ester carboxylesterase
MDSTTTRIWTPARIVALGLIAVLIAGLAYLRFGTGPDTVSVPDGAKAGDLTLEGCDYATEKGTYAADCGTLVVRENRADPGSRLIALPVTRIRARSDHPAEPVFRLQGGPGISNMEFEQASRFADDRDVVLVGYRGVDGSERLDCPEVESALKHSTALLGQTSFSAYGDAFRDCATRLTDEGVDLAGYGVVPRADDIEAARRALGYDRIDLVSESAGTRYAMVYAWRYPEHVHRSVMVAVNPPGHFVWDGRTTDEQVRRYAARCSEDEHCSSRTSDLAATFRRVNRDMPDHWGFLRIDGGNVRTATFWSLMESSMEAAGPVSSPLAIDAWISADKGDPSGLWFQSLLGDMAFPKSFVWGEMASIAAADKAAAERHYASGEPGTILGTPGNDFVWGGGELLDAWPGGGTGGYDRVRTLNVETLLIGGELDFAAPPQNATKELLPHLPNGKQIVIPSMGHSTTFWAEQPEASTRLINTYLDSGRVDDSLYEPIHVDFSPEVTGTALAKGVAGTMVGLALLTVLSLLWMARRVRRRGGYGRKAAALLRSIYPVILGLGGWFLGVLVVTATMPSVALDSVALSVLCVGAPIGLGIYLAWVKRDWSRTTKRTGLAAAAAGALIGAWLGFNATEDLAALLATIIGALAGANLLLLALDIRWDRQSHDRFATRPAGAVEARPSLA